MSIWTDLVPLGPSRLTLNGQLRGARNATMLQVLGNPRANYSDECQDPTNLRILKLVVREDVGPFKARGLRPAVETLKRIFEDVHANEPDVYKRLGNMGMLCCRFVRHSRSAISNHSWGSAIDLTIDGILDQPGPARRGELPTAQRGLLQIFKHFNKHGFFWGAAFPREDAMHFEASDQLIREWQATGALDNAPAPLETAHAIEIGDRGAEVLDLQRRLAVVASGDLVADGVFGAMTRAAIIEFQHRAGLAPDGVVGERTLATLKQETPGV